MSCKQSRISRPRVGLFPRPTHRAGLIIFLFICLHLMVAGHLFGRVPRGLITLPESLRRSETGRKSGWKQQQLLIRQRNFSGIFAAPQAPRRLWTFFKSSETATPATFLFIPLKLSQQEIKVVQWNEVWSDSEVKNPDFVWLDWGLGIVWAVLRVDVYGSLQLMVFRRRLRWKL